jgi:hypothetical protein
LNLSQFISHIWKFNFSPVSVLVHLADGSALLSEHIQHISDFHRLLHTCSIYLLAVYSTLQSVAQIIQGWIILLLINNCNVYGMKQSWPNLSFIPEFAYRNWRKSQTLSPDNWPPDRYLNPGTPPPWGPPPSIGHRSADHSALTYTLYISFYIFRPFSGKGSQGKVQPIKNSGTIWRNVKKNS